MFNREVLSFLRRQPAQRVQGACVGTEEEEDPSALQIPDTGEAVEQKLVLQNGLLHL